MANPSAYSSLVDHLKQTTLLGQIAGLLHWDRETMMPKSGIEARAEQSALLAAEIHGRCADERVGEWLAAIETDGLDAVGQANVREARRGFERANRVPVRLAEALAKLTTRAQGIWAQARADDDFPAYAPVLEEIIAIKREEAACLKRDGEELYDALLDDFEPGMKTAELSTLLARLRPGLSALRQKIEASGVQVRPLAGDFPDDKQLELARRLAGVFGYDWDGGRLDLAVHPFSSGYRGDARITTRVDADNVFDCLYSTIHEVGHATYEQGRDPAMDSTPAGGYASMGVHESQSRMAENQIGRSRAFMDWLYPAMVETFGDIGLSGPDELFAAANRVEAGFIRTEADEVHYNLHILMRFDLELALVRDELQVGDLEAAWNERFAADFGRAVDKPSNGVLQDVHWSAGLFGYFPTYSLGNIYAGELFAAIERAIPQRDALIAKAELGAIHDWQRENIHRHGTLYSAPELIERACGKKPDERALLDYLEAKFGALYGF